MALQLHVVVASTRPGRKGPLIAGWFHDRARDHGGFETRLVDLAELDLPLFDEPNHPRLGTYERDHTRAWSAIAAAADAFVFVTPEYNFSAPPSLINALDYLHREWAYAPVGFVSYGGVSGGTRSVQMLKQVVTAVRMMPVPEGVAIPFFARHVDDGGRFDPGETQARAAAAMLDELARWADALRGLRGPIHHLAPVDEPGRV
jgi:NAD(P)H-dependent FMN reductase